MTTPRWAHTWAATVERRRGAILLGTLLLSLLCAFSLTRLRLDFDVFGMLPTGRPAFDDFRAFVDEFGELNELVVLIDGGTPGQRRAFADRFGARLARLDTVRRVHVRIDRERIRRGMLGRYLFHYLPLSAYDELATRLTPAGIDAAVRDLRTALAAPFDLTTPQFVAEDPLGLRRLVVQHLRDLHQRPPTSGNGYFTSSDGTALLLVVEPRAGAFDIAFTERFLADVGAAEAIARQGLDAPGLTVRYTGSYVYAAEDAATLRTDLRRYSILALVGVLAVFFLGYRDLRVLPAVAVPVVVTALTTFATSVLLFDQLNAVSLAFAAILYGLSIDAGIHFHTRLLHEGAHQPPRAAIACTLAGLGRAHVTASLTTATVFALIGASQLTPVHQLGWLTAIGMLLNLAGFFTVHPALGFLLLQRRHAPPPPPGAAGLERLGRMVVRGAIPLRLGALVLALALLPAATAVRIDTSLDHLRPQRSRAAEVEREIAARFDAPPWDGAVLVRRETLERALVDSEAVTRALARLRAEGAVARVQSVAPVLPSQRRQRARLARYESLRRAQAIDRLRHALAREGFAVTPFEDFLRRFARAPQTLVRLNDPALEPFAPAIASHVREHADAYTVATYVHPAPDVSLGEIRERLRAALPDVPHRLASRRLLEAELRAMLHRELRVFALGASAGSLLLLALGLGSIRRTLGIFLPAVLVVEVLFAVMRLLGAALDPVNLIVIPMILGLSVDDGIYINAAEREHGDWPTALRLGGRAVLLTSLTTMTGFGFLALSRYPALASLGTFAATGLFLSMVSSMILVPAFCRSARDHPPEHRGDPPGAA